MVKYKDAIASTVPWLKEQINKSPDKTIRALIDDIKIVLGPEFGKKPNMQIYWGLKVALFREGIIVDKGKSVTGEDLLIMRMATSDDWKSIARAVAIIVTGRSIAEWEYPNIIGTTPEDWRKFVIENFMAEY